MDKKGILTIAIIMVFIGTFLAPICNAISESNNPTLNIEKQPNEQNILEEDEKVSLESKCLWIYGPYLKATVKGTIGQYHEDFALFGYSFKSRLKIYADFDNEISICPLRGKEINFAPTEGKYYFHARIAKWDVFEEIEKYEKYYVEGTVIWCFISGDPE